MKFPIPALALSVSLFALSSCETTSQSGGGDEGAGTTTTAAATPTKPYPLATCLVTGEGLESKGGAITQVYQGQEVKFCCKPCQFAFKNDPQTYLAKIQ